MLRIIAAIWLAASLALPASATEEDAGQLFEALRLPELIAIMREEGLVYAEELEDELLGGRGGPEWARSATGIYALDEMESHIATEFARGLEGVDTAPLLKFFRSDRGREIVRLEIEARRALQDEGIEEAAEERAAELREEADPRIDLLDRFVEVNELIDANVAGALNSNYAFYRGLIDGGAFDDSMTEDQILSDVWAQEAEIRADTFDWIYGYLALAYQPLSDEDLKIYTALSETDEGRALNTAIFGAFDGLYVEISEALGRSAARFMTGEDI